MEGSEVGWADERNWSGYKDVTMTARDGVRVSLGAALWLERGEKKIDSKVRVSKRYRRETSSFVN